MPYVGSTDGVKVYYEVLGEGEVPLLNYSDGMAPTPYNRYTLQ